MLKGAQVATLRKELTDTEAELQRATRLLKLADPEGYFKDPNSMQAGGPGSKAWLASRIAGPPWLQACRAVGEHQALGCNIISLSAGPHSS